MKTNVKWKTAVATLALTAVLTACGELFDVDDERPATLADVSVAISRHSVDLVVGDTFHIDLSVVADSAANTALYWDVADTAVVAVSEGRVEALSPGETVVRVTAVEGLQSDSCRVRVLPRWTVDPYRYQFDMVLYANVTVGGQAAADGDLVAAFATDATTGREEVRGVGRMQSAAGQTYTVLRIYSNEEYTLAGDVGLTLRCYSAARRQLLLSADRIAFSSNATIGTLSRLYDLNFE